MSALETGIAATEKLQNRTGMSHAQMMGAVRFIGGATIGIAVIVLVLNEIFTLEAFETDADGNYEGPFGSILGSLESTGAAALGLLVIGLLVLAANQVMGFFGSGGF